MPFPQINFSQFGESPTAGQWDVIGYGARDIVQSTASHSPKPKAGFVAVIPPGDPRRFENLNTDGNVENVFVPYALISTRGHLSFGRIGLRMTFTPARHVQAVFPYAISFLARLVCYNAIDAAYKTEKHDVLFNVARAYNDVMRSMTLPEDPSAGREVREMIKRLNNLAHCDENMDFRIEKTEMHERLQKQRCPGDRESHKALLNTLTPSRALTVQLFLRQKMGFSQEKFEAVPAPVQMATHVFEQMFGRSAR